MSATDVPDRVEPDTDAADDTPAADPPPVIPRPRAPVRCTRHTAWLVSCQDCTAWHAHQLTAARGGDRD